MKSMLTSPPVLSYPDFSEPFQLHTDASGEGLGAVLEQTSDGVGHPVALLTLVQPSRSTCIQARSERQRYGIQHRARDFGWSSTRPKDSILLNIWER